MAARRAIVASHGPSSRPGSKEPAAFQAWTKVCCVASSAIVRSPRTRKVTAKTRRPYSR